jgi:phosphotransferase system HPr (HPr) family protein
MPRSIVTIEWEQGLHLRAAARVVRCAQQFKSAVTLRLSGNVANAKNILSIVALCAVVGSTLEIEAVGDDEQDALRAVETALTTDGGSDALVFKSAR